MARIEIISASAGSGKTYRLATVLHDAIATAAARPDAVLATTFTNRAAAELKERTRTRLLQAGRVEDAHRLGAARIGTVNAVCGRLVADFAFELGLAPNLRVIDERAAAMALRQAMSRVVTADDTEKLADVKRRFDESWEWQRDVERIVTLARANRVAPEALARSAERSIQGLLTLFGAPEADGAPLEAALAEGLARFLNEVDLDVDTTKKTREQLDKAKIILGKIRRGLPLQWADWWRAEALDPGKKSFACATPAKIAGGGHDRHPGIRADLATTCTLVYAIAARTLRAYEDYKRAWGAIDFTDQEVFALQLLERKEVRARLGGEIDLVLVDEFQDTSPLQLAIFLRLADVAKRSVWVGDQKQSIFGFRGTDPSLMDAAVDTILAGAEPETLAKSWRSRPGLVDLTSDVFARGFACDGVPESRVRLEAATAEDAAAGLGPVVERWRLPAKNLSEDAAYLAAAVRDLLLDPEVRVRDRATGVVRALRPGDVAILCYQNATCGNLARELAKLGVRAVLARTGLMATPEGLLVLAGLRLFVDPQDTLAAAELARLVAYPASGDAWLTDLMMRPAREAFAELEVVRRIAAARAAEPHAGALAALDAVLEAVEARERCLEWGESAFRLANLDMLRAHAVTYANLCASDGRGCTPAGLVAAFVELADSGADARAVVTHEDAVHVSTWHSAKGLEWPITVLFDLDHDPYFTALGVQVVADRAGFDLVDPLAERWIRYWPSPYHPMQRKTPFHQRLLDAPETAAVREREERQARRLLYVGWTRARDRVVLAARPAGLAKGMITLLKAADGTPLVVDPASGAGPTADVVWCDRPTTVRLREGAMLDPVRRDVTPGAGYDPTGPRAYPPAVTVPSSLVPPDGLRDDGGEVDVVAAAAGLTLERYGERLMLRGDPEMQRVGEAIHGFLAADRPTLDPDERRAIAVGLLERWGVAAALGPDDLVRASDRLRAWVDARFPGAVWHREWPLLHRQPNGTVIRGTADLVIEHADGYAVIDHKSFPGSAEQAAARAAGFQGQLSAYASAVATATGRPVTGCYVHLPVLGAVVPLPTT